MTTHRHAFWTAEVEGGRFVAGMTVDGTDYVSPEFATEAEADDEMGRLVAEMRNLAERLGARVVDVSVASPVPEIEA